MYDIAEATRQVLTEAYRKQLNEVGDFLLNYDKNSVYDIDPNDLQIDESKSEPNADNTQFLVKVDYPKVNNFYTYVLFKETGTGRISAKLQNKDNIDYGDNLSNLSYNKNVFIEKAYEYLEEQGLVNDDEFADNRQTQKNNQNNQNNQIKTGQDPKLSKDKDVDNNKFNKANVPTKGLKLNQAIKLNPDYYIPEKFYYSKDMTIVRVLMAYNDRTQQTISEKIEFYIDVRLDERHTKLETRFPKDNTEKFDEYSKILYYNKEDVSRIAIQELTDIDVITTTKNSKGTKFYKINKV